MNRQIGPLVLGALMLVATGCGSGAARDQEADHAAMARTPPVQVNRSRSITKRSWAKSTLGNSSRIAARFSQWIAHR